MNSETTLTIIAISLNLAIDVGLVGFLIYGAVKAFKLKQTLMEDERKFLENVAIHSGSKVVVLNKLTLSILWVVILTFSILAVSYSISCFKLYSLLFSKV